MVASHRIRILGRELQVKSTASAETVLDIESFVNRKIADAAASVKGGDQQVVAILALMTIAETYLSLQKSREASQHIDSERIDRLIEKVDRHLSGV